MSMLDRVLTVVMVAAAVAMAIGVIRGRRVTYRDIKTCEVIPDIAAGNELLQDVMKEDELRADRTRCAGR